MRGLAMVLTASILLGSGCISAWMDQHPGTTSPSPTIAPSACAPTVPPGGDPDHLPDWRPNASLVPASGSYIVADSQAGDRVANGADSVYTGDIDVQQSNRTLVIQTTGDTSWRIDIAVPVPCARPEEGYYPDLAGDAQADASHGGLRAWLNGHSCTGEYDGTLVIDHLVYDGIGRLRRVDLRFEQHCLGSAGHLLGQVGWTA